mgnify:CR=1 FL=1
MYKVLWFDDEHETLEDIVEDCLLEDIQLIGYGNAKDGIKALYEDKYRFDAVLLDGMFFNDDNQSGDPNDSAFGEVAIALGNLKAEGIILPWFVYSGQKNFVKDKSKMIELLTKKAFANGKVFDKNLDEDFKELCLEIKKEADLQPITKAKHDNPDLIEIFEKGYLSQDEEEQLIQLIIKPLPKNKSEIKEFLTNIRSIHESCLIKLESIKVIPDANDKFSKINKQLSGNKQWDDTLKKLIPKTYEYQNPVIENLNAWIYFTCGTYIHNLKQQHYAGYMISQYAIESLRTGLFEILLWFKKTYEENT